MLTVVKARGSAVRWWCPHLSRISISCGFGFAVRNALQNDSSLDRLIFNENCAKITRRRTLSYVSGTFECRRCILVGWRSLADGSMRLQDVIRAYRVVAPRLVAFPRHPKVPVIQRPHDPSGRTIRGSDGHDIPVSTCRAHF